MRASFVLVNYNRKDELMITLSKSKELIKGNFRDYEIVVVDNASTDGSTAAVVANFPEVILIENTVNTGAPAWNLGFEKALGDYFIIIDDDSHIEYGLEEALIYMDHNPTVGVVALNVVTGPYTSDMWGWKDGDETVGFIGCGAILRRETYEKIGGYADWMFLYVNEWEYGLRCIDAGYHVRFFANSKVIHRASKIHRSTRRLREFVTMHEMAIVYKHFSSQRFKYLLRIMLNGLKSVKDLNFREMSYNISGMIAFWKMRKTLKRTPVSPYAQDLFANTFLVTKIPVFGFLKQRLNKG